ncbi:MAG TPA: hypothetical protein VG347_22500 [Verrucomicrobiae bacterium]|nr:hypothetical protein [Verrucomicrobiae bacterium]
MDLKSFELFSKEHAATEKFDYYICSVAGALFAYIGQAYSPHIFDSWYYFLMPLALLVLTLCFCIGLWTIHLSKHITTLNREVLARMEENMDIMKCLENTSIQIFSSPKLPNKSRAELNEILNANKSEINAFRDDAMRFLKKADRLNLCRNVFLGIGFLLILASKVLQPYFAAK